MNIYLEAFGLFSKIGVFTIGGGYAMVPLIEEEIVDKRKWIAKDDFIDLLAISQSTPGILAVNISIFIGYKLRGFRGSLVTTLGTILPSFFIILAIAMFFHNFKDNVIVERIFKGIRPAADYETLVKWWAKNTENRPLFIGQSVMNTVQNADPQNPSINQLPRKMALQRAYQTIGGSCQWPASAVVENAGKYRDALIAEYHKYPALPPVFEFMDNEAPSKVRKVKPVWTADGYILFWTEPKYKDEMNRAVQYVVYRFDAKEKVDISNPAHIIAITRDNFYKLPYEDGKTKYRYVVTALDRLHNESKTVAKKVKL